MGFGSSILRRNAVDFKENLVQLGNNKYLSSLEAMFEFTKYTRKGNYHSVSVNYQIQTSYSKKDEANYYQLVGKWQEIHAGWQNGFEKLYEDQSAWSWLYTYGRENYNFSVYIKEDLRLNNSPTYLTNGTAIQKLQNGTNGRSTKPTPNSVTKNYTRALAQIEKTPWVKELIQKAVS